MLGGNPILNRVPIQFRKSLVEMFKVQKSIQRKDHYEFSTFSIVNEIFASA